MFPAQNLELFYWNDEAGDMDVEVYDLNWQDDLKDVYRIEIVLMDYPICDEVAIVTYKGLQPHPPYLNHHDNTVLYTIDEYEDVQYTTVVYSPNPEYNDILLGDSPKEAARYVLYSKPDHINRIDRFRQRENPVDLPDWRQDVQLWMRMPMKEE